MRKELLGVHSGSGLGDLDAATDAALVTDIVAVPVPETDAEVDAVMVVDAVLVSDTVAVPVLETDAVDDADVDLDAVAVADVVDVAVFEIEGVRLAVAE